MKPIKLMPRENPVYMTNARELDDDMDFNNGIHYHYMPEFLEEVYDDGNAQSLKDNNKSLIHYANIRDNLHYYCTWKDDRVSSIVEYYLDDNNNWVVYLIEVPKSKSKKYYPSLQQVSVCKKVGVVV